MMGNDYIWPVRPRHFERDIIEVLKREGSYGSWGKGGMR